MITFSDEANLVGCIECADETASSPEDGWLVWEE